MNLSSLIVQHEVATMRQVEEALARQVIYGGDLATNLLEIASVDEWALTRLIAEEMGLPPAPAGELPFASDAARIVPAEMATKCGLVPVTLEGDVLVLAVIEPLPPDLEDQLMFALGVAIEQRAALAVRVRQAIAKLWAVPLDPRLQRLVARLSGAPIPAGSTLPLDSPQTSVPPPAPTKPISASGPIPEARPAPSGALQGGTLNSLPSPTPVVTEGRSALLQRNIPSIMRSTRRRRGPLTFDAGQREAEEGSDRDALLDLFFEFSRQFFDYTALFLVHGDIAEGRDAFGPGTSADRVMGIGVPLDLPSLMATARDDRVPIVARAPVDGLDAVLRADLQRPREADMAIVPLVVRTRAVAILLGDCGDGGVEADTFDQVTTFATVVGKALERLIVRRKLEGGGAVGKASETKVFASPPPPPPLGLASAAPPIALEAEAMDIAQFDANGVPSPRLPRVTISMMPPPPANVVIVRKLSDPPIPREDPVDSEPLPSPSPPPYEVAPRAGVSARPGARPSARPPIKVPAGEKVLEGLDARALFDILGWETGSEEPDLPPPSSSAALPPHRPPLAYVTPAPDLPSVIVDLEHELAVMVDRVASGAADESAEGELLRQGERAMRVIMARFPGPVIFERSRIASTPKPPLASECGPLLRLVVRERKVALPFVIESLSHRDPEVRGWATYLLCELPYPEAIPHAVARLRDADSCTRAAAALAIASLANAFPDATREAVRKLATSGEPADRAAAIRAMAQLRQATLVPDLLGALADKDERVVATAHDALVQLTRQDFGSDARPWRSWWDENSSRHRIEWLIGALTHEVSEIRRASAEELRAITREYFGYSSELPPRDRERARQRYSDWWITEGRLRFQRR